MMGASMGTPMPGAPCTGAPETGRGNSSGSLPGSLPGTVKGAVQDAGEGVVSKARGRREQLREQTDRKIMRATLEILISDGIGAVTIEEVARRSGVAKTTIYRRYRNADDLLQRIQVEVAGLPDFDDLQPSRDGLRVMLQRIQGCFDSELGLKAVGVVLTSDNDSLKAITTQVLEPAEQRFMGFMQRGIRAGVLRDGLDCKFLFSTVLGSMLACKALAEHKPDMGQEAGSWADRMAALLWPSVCAGTNR